VILIFVAMFKIDWEKILEKYVNKESDRKD